MKIKLHEVPRMPSGFSCGSKNCGMKKIEPDLSVFYSEKDCQAAAVFTRNQVPGAPIIYGREIIENGQLRAIVANSKISNVGTGEQGLVNVKKTADFAAKELGLRPQDILVSSTGIIAKQLPIDKIEKGLKGFAKQLRVDPLIAAKGIMTTDTHPKAISTSIDSATLSIVAKGSGMISPNMATMLVFIFTDADIEKSQLKLMLEKTVNETFNMLSIDTDMSTSDTCVMMANGMAGKIDLEKFEQGLFHCCELMTEILARDAEGATKLVRSEIKGAKNENDAKTFAKALVESPLIKTMAFGADPNIGRILMALGKCLDCNLDLQRVKLAINQIEIFAAGQKANYDEENLRQIISGDPLVLQVDLALGHASAKAYGCDLTHGYIDENAAYYSS